jgi:hypothetical protein
LAGSEGGNDDGSGQRKQTRQGRKTIVLRISAGKRGSVESETEMFQSGDESRGHAGVRFGGMSMHTTIIGAPAIEGGRSQGVAWLPFAKGG